MNFPTLHMVPWQQRTLGDLDRRGRAAETFADPIGVPAIAIYQPTADDLVDSKNETPIDRRLIILAPEWPGKPKDLITAWGVQWRQENHPRRWGGGFHGWDPGVEIHFTRAEEAD